MLTIVSCSAADRLPARTPRPAQPLLRRLPLLLGLALGLTGCQSRPAAPATPAVSVRSLPSPSASVTQVQASPLYQQARQACKRHDYRHAADLLQQLAKAPGLPPEAVSYCQAQRDLCLKDAGLLPVTPNKPTVSVLAAVPARTPGDADCGPRALLLLCQQLSIQTDLPSLRKMAGTTAAGTTLAGLQQAARKLGLKAEGVQVSREALPDTELPALAWVHRDHFVALLALAGTGDHATATLHDPNRPAEETISQEQLLQRCGGYLLLVHR
jgi:hypothetical protein